MTNHLVLKVVDFRSPASFQWRLYAGDELLANHHVDLDPKGFELAALLNLEVWLGNATNDADGRAELARLGTFLAERVLGKVYTVLQNKIPVVVEVQVPTAAAALYGLPFETACVYGVVLFPGVRFVFAPENIRAPDRDPAPHKVRVLVVASASDAAQRESLLFQRLTLELALEGRSIEVRTLAAGTTRRMLKDALAEPEAFDVVHLCCEKLEAGLSLQREDGSTDRVTAGDLLDLLSVAKVRPQLVVCSSSEQDAVPGQTAATKPKTVDDNDNPYRGARMLSLMSAIAIHTGGKVAGSRVRLSPSFAENLWTEMYRALFLHGADIAEALNEARVEPRMKLQQPSGYHMPDFVGPILFGRAADARSLQAPLAAVPGENLVHIHAALLRDEATAAVGSVRKSGFLAGQYLAGVGRWQEALSALEDAAGRTPYDPEIKQVLGLAQRIADQLLPGDAKEEARLAVARCLLAAGRYQAAATLCTEVLMYAQVRRASIGARAAYLLCDILFKQGRILEAHLGDIIWNYMEDELLGPYTSFAFRAQIMRFDIEDQRGQTPANPDLLWQRAMRISPTEPTIVESIPPDRSCELILEVCRRASELRGEYEHALSYGAQLRGFLDKRTAPALEVANVMLGDYGALAGLGRLDEAEKLLGQTWWLADKVRHFRYDVRLCQYAADLFTRRGDAQRVAYYQEQAKIPWNRLIFHRTMGSGDIAAGGGQEPRMVGGTPGWSEPPSLDPPPGRRAARRASGWGGPLNLDPPPPGFGPPPGGGFGLPPLLVPMMGVPGFGVGPLNENKPWKFSKILPVEEAPIHWHLNSWFPESPEEEDTVRLPVGKPACLCVNLGPPHIPQGAGQTSTLDAAAIARITKTGNLDILVLCPGAHVKPVRKRLPLPPDPKCVLEFALTPLRSGKLDLQIVLLIKNEPIHRTYFPIEAIANADMPVHGAVL